MGKSYGNPMGRISTFNWKISEPSTLSLDPMIMNFFVKTLRLPTIYGCRSHQVVIPIGPNLIWSSLKMWTVDRCDVPSSCWWFRRNPAFTSWGNGSKNPLIYEGFCTSERWLYSRISEPSTVPIPMKRIWNNSSWHRLSWEARRIKDLCPGRTSTGLGQWCNLINCRSKTSASTKERRGFLVKSWDSPKSLHEPYLDVPGS